jgi:hypothetical protein
VLREAHALARDAIHVRRADLVAAVAAELSIAEVVRQDVDDVRASLTAVLGRHLCVAEAHQAGERTEEE